MSSQAETEPPNSGKILIVGGYGQVGRSIAERLAPPFPGRVTIAGRNLDKAASAAAEIGYGAEGRAVDISGADKPDTLDGVSLVVVCLDHTGTKFVERCLSHGIHYVDISANNDFLSQVETLDRLATRNTATALLSVGVAPGLTNMLAARARDRMPEADRIDIILELGLGDQHGQAAIEWMLDNLDTTYEVKENGQPRPVRTFGEHLKARLPGQDHERAAYRFNFSDQHTLGRTLDVPTISTWFRFDNRIATRLLVDASRAGLGRLLRRRRWRKIALWLFMNTHAGSDTCGVAVRATGPTVDGAKTLTLGLIGRNEALMTAIVAAETARQLLDGNPTPGVHHSHQTIALDPVIAELKSELPDLITAL